MTIGIPGWLVGPNSFGVTISYVEFARDYIGGNDIRILMPDTPVWSDLDLLLLTGGADINPSRYGEMPGFYTDKPDIIKEYFDVHVLPRYIEQRVPIAGICRGCQTLAVHWGEKLIQNMWHETNKSDNPYESVHGIKIIGDEKRKVKVNSRHHQSIKFPSSDSLVKVLATHSAYSRDVEAIRIQDYPAIGVQGHPEDCNDSTGVDYTLKLISEIIKK